MREVHVITDLQFGSTGKGLFAGFLAYNLRPDTVVAAWGPNSGHTFVDADGTKHVHTMVPNGCVSPNLKRIMIGPGAVIDIDAMYQEIIASHIDADILIHESAAVLGQRHRNAEAEYGFKIGSTMKGTAEAVIEKMRRNSLSILARVALLRTPLEGYVVTAEEYNFALDDSDIVLVEGAQGFSLSLNQGFHPHVTARDCTTHQILSDCAIPFGVPLFYIYGVARTFPIRVANRFKDGQQVGTSGPCYHDQREIEWPSLHREAELTTVTKLPRRVFTFSERQVADAIRMNGVDSVFLNFCNYPADVPEIIRTIEKYAPVKWTGWGPKVTDVKHTTEGQLL